ncbi:MAG: hypothetical protein HYX46_04415 [Betaproteobacteria bacterium]|nr:hypothetical protein [Betaproteobacteria bacterium]
MKSFEHGYLREMPISHRLLSTVRTLGEFSGREGLRARQSPEVLDTLRRAAIVQSVESSNRIEGVTVADGRIDPLVLGRSKPRDRAEMEIAGYRDVLAQIHTDPARLKLSTDLIRGFHRGIYRYADPKAGGGSARITQFSKFGPTAARSSAFVRFPRLPRRNS